MIYGDWEKPVSEGYTYTTSGLSCSTDTTKWVTGTTTYEWPVTTGETITVSSPPTEYVLEEGVMKWKDEVTDDWYRVDEEPDPFALEIKPLESKPKKAVKVKARIKLDKKLGVDVEKIADLLFQEDE